MKWRFDNLIICFAIIIIGASCNSISEKDYFFVIGKKYKLMKAQLHGQKGPSPPPPLPGPMSYYPYINILLLNGDCYLHYDLEKKYPRCGTGYSNRRVRRIDLKPEQIIPLFKIDSSLSALAQKSPDKLIIDIASNQDTIRNSNFPVVLNSLSKAGYTTVRVRNFTDEEASVLNLKFNNISFNIDSIDWYHTPKVDALFDLNEDGKFEIHESLN